MALERLQSFEENLQSIINESVEGDDNALRARDLLERLPSFRDEDNTRIRREVNTPQTKELKRQISTEDALLRSISREETSRGPSIRTDVAESGGVYSWGRPDIGTLLRSSAAYDIIEKIGLERIRQISSNQYHSAACSVTGEVYIAGLNISGQVCQQKGDHTSNDQDEIHMKPKLVEPLLTHRICQVSCGVSHTACITAQGLCITFGSNECGELGHSKGLGSASDVQPQLSNVKPALVQGMSFHLCVQVACGDKFTIIACHNGEVYGCGAGCSTGIPHGNDISRAERIPALVGVHVRAISATYMHTIATTTNGMAYGWGSSPMLGIEDREVCQEPELLQVPKGLGRIIGAATGYRHSILWTDKGQLLGAGLNKHGQLGLPLLPMLSAFTHIPLPDEADYCVEACCGVNHTVVLCKQQILPPDNTSTNTSNDSSTCCTAVYAFGSNNFGQVDPGEGLTSLRQPTLVGKLDTLHVLRVFAGGDQSFAIGIKNTSTITTERNNDFRHLLTRSFSYASNKVKLGPITADEFIDQLTIPDESPGQRSVVFDILSSTTILNNSFYSSSVDMPFYLDVIGLEKSYVALLRDDHVYNHSQKLMGALNTALDDVTIMMKYHNDMAVRVIMILWQCPLTCHPQLGSKFMKRICDVFHDDSISSVERKNMIEQLGRYPKHIFKTRLLDSLNTYVSHLIASEYLNSSGAAAPHQETLSPDLEAACQLMGVLFLSNCDSRLLSVKSFNNDLLSKDVRIIEQVVYPQFIRNINNRCSDNPIGFCKYPFMISVETKRDLLMSSTHHDQQAAQSRLAMQSIFQGTLPYFVMKVDRRNLVRQAMTYCESVNDATLKMPLKIVFEGEEGIDEGGVKKEFFQLLTEQLFDVRFGMFSKCGEEGTRLWFNKDCNFNLDEYRLIGILIGLAVYNGIILNISLPKALYKKILNQPMKPEDLSSVDPALFNGLDALRKYEPVEDVENIFCLDHEVVWQDSLLGNIRRKELIPNGAETPVTGDNRDLYVEAYTKWVLIESIAPQFDAFINGFRRVIDPSAMSMFLPLELELLLTGYPHLDFGELQSGVRYEGWESNSAECILWFWEVINEFSLSEKQKFLKFISGSEKAPIEGLKKLNFVLQRMGPSSNLLPTAHTCFNTLLLPEYSSKQLLSERLKKAIEECEGFGLK